MSLLRVVSLTAASFAPFGEVVAVTATGRRAANGGTETCHDVPMGLRRFLVVVAPRGPVPDSAQARSFLTDGWQGVNYGRGVWHHPILALDGETDFLMLGRTEDGRDCNLRPFAGGATLRIEALPG